LVVVVFGNADSYFYEITYALGLHNERFSSQDCFTKLYEVLMASL